MTTVEHFYALLKVDPNDLWKEENYLVELDLLLNISSELKEIFRAQYKNYFKLMNFTKEMEKAMIEENLERYIINDIISTGEYTLQGIADYTRFPQDVVCDVIMGLNKSPSGIFFRRIVALHRMVRGELYDKIMKKIISNYQ